MEIGIDVFNEILTGIYASEDKKTLVIDVFVLTALNRSADNELIANEISNTINEWKTNEYQNSVEHIVFSCGQHCGFNYKSIPINVGQLCTIFSKLSTIVHGSDIRLLNIPQMDFRVVSDDVLDDLAYNADEDGLKEQAEFYYRWEAVVEYYWGNYRLGHFLQQNGRAEFEECYKKIAGANDWCGDASSEYGVWLHKQGRYSEAIQYLTYATRAVVDTCNREYAEGALCDSVRNECPYWKYFDDEHFVKYLIYYLECDSTRDNSDIEKVLLERASSENKQIAQSAKEMLRDLSSIGSFMIVDSENASVDIFDFINIKNAKEIFSQEIEDDYDIDCMLSRAYNVFEGELSEKVAQELENALLAIECDDELDYEDVGMTAKIALFWFYYNGKYEIEDEGIIEAMSLLNKRKAAEILRYEFIFRLDINPKFDDLKGEEGFDKLLEEAYTIYPQKDMVVRSWAERCAVKCEVDKLVDIISCSEGKLVSFIAFDLMDEWEYFFECEGAEYSSDDIEKILFALSQKGVHVAFLLSLYQFGCAKILTSMGEYEVLQPELKDGEKAKTFAKAKCIDLLTETIEIIL